MKKAKMKVSRKAPGKRPAIRTVSAKKAAAPAARPAARDRDIIAVLLTHHKPLKDLIEKLKDDEREHADQRQVFQEFAPLLLSHAEPEEKTLYMKMKDHEELRKEGFEGDVEHHLAVQMINEVVNTEDPDEWMAKVKVLAELVEHHLEEEEGELFPAVKEEFDLETRIELAAEYLRLYEETSAENEADEARFQITAEHMLRADP